LSRKGRSEGWDRRRLRSAAARILAAGLEAADPARLVHRNLRLRGSTLRVLDLEHRLDRGRLALLAAGKAASRMARAAEERLGDRLDESLAVDTSASTPLRRTRLLLAGHPVPDQRGRAAADEAEDMARRLGKDDLLLVLLSGGASALLPAPAQGLSLDDKAAVTSLLLRAGATIQELNTVRKHLSRLKGGGLARAAAPARVVALVLSDVIGDDVSIIASGPTAADPTTYAEALAVLRRRGVLESAPAPVRQRLEAGARGEIPETPKPGEALFRRVTTRVVGSNRLSVEAAARAARSEGFRTLVLSASLEGEAREASRVLVSILRECAEAGRPLAPPACLLAGGETTVTVRGSGHGGRNQELVVAASDALASLPRHAVVASLATDGIDGRSEAAGGVADGRTTERARALGLAPAAAFLAESDSRGFLAPLGDLILTGPTGTNVMDLTLLLLGGLREMAKPGEPSL
jgi:hydroxypyruvate reductase